MCVFGVFRVFMVCFRVFTCVFVARAGLRSVRVFVPFWCAPVRLWGSRFREFSFAFAFESCVSERSRFRAFSLIFACRQVWPFSRDFACLCAIRYFTSAPRIRFR